MGGKARLKKGGVKAVFEKIRDFLVFLLPIVIFFSYYPVISLGSSETMNFELSLPLIWLFIFSLFSLPDFLRAILGIFKRGKGEKSEERIEKGVLGWFRKKTLVFILFAAIFATVSLFWTANFTRGFLTVGILWGIIISGVGILEILKRWEAKWKYRLVLVFLGMTIIVCAFCWAQTIADVFGVGRETTLACLGCTYRSFGFPHPSGFAIEPQFMGNLLLVPIFLLGWILWKTRDIGGASWKKKWRKTGFSRGKKVGRPEILASITKGQRRGLWLILFIATSTLFLTFSRGAIYAFGVGMIVFMVVLILKKQFPVGMIFVSILAFIFTLCFQGVFAEISPTKDTFSSGVSKSLHQLSLGIIDLRGVEFSGGGQEGQVGSSADKAVEMKGDGGESDRLQEGGSKGETAQFSGYVAESTDTRTKLTEVALKTWGSSVENMVFGVGLGGAGVKMHEKFPEEVESAKEIVQNQYASILLELGVIGAILVVLAVLCLVFWALWEETRELLLPIIVAFGVSLLFFAGLPNALHIYLLPVVLFGLCLKYVKI